jgi:hypothetical protein
MIVLPCLADPKKIIDGRVAPDNGASIRRADGLVRKSRRNHWRPSGNGTASGAGIAPIIDVRQGRDGKHSFRLRQSARSDRARGEGSQKREEKIRQEVR